MNLQTEIKVELWNSVSKSYEAGSYRNAILDAMHYLSNELRERANIDGDGASLVGQALGGDNPRLRINRFQTESEKNEQKGVEQIIRGMYQGIRNPRSHEQTEDKQTNANAIILFVDYLLGIISQAKEPFVLEQWSERVFDPAFVTSFRYAQLLVSEIPPKKYTDAIITIYREKMLGDGNKLEFIFDVLIPLLSDSQLAEFLSVVSNELKTAQEDQVIKTVLQILPENAWGRIDEVARIRIENKLIQSIKLGKTWHPIPKENDPGWLATWGAYFIQHFTLKDRVSSAMLEKLEGDEQDQNYIAKYFMWTLPQTVSESSWNPERQRGRLIGAIVRSVSKPLGSVLLRDQLVACLSGYPPEWKKLILDGLKSLENDDPEYYKKVVKAQEPEDFPF